MKEEVSRFSLHNNHKIKIGHWLIGLMSIDPDGQLNTQDINLKRPINPLIKNIWMQIGDSNTIKFISLRILKFHLCQLIL